MNRSLALLSATDDDLPWSEVLQLALQEGVALVGGLGGLVHLRGPVATPGLRLAASTGLPPAFTRRWQHIRGDATAAPRAATLLCLYVWFPVPEGPGTGMASMPLRTADGEPFGALTVVTGTAGEPTPQQQDALRAVAGWPADQLRHAEPPSVLREARIQEVTAALAEAVTSLDVVDAIAKRVLPPFGASGLTVQVVEADRMRVIGVVSYLQPFVDLIGGPLRDTPQAEALRTHEPWFISSPQEYAKRYPKLAEQLRRTGKQAWAFMPLVVSGRVVGLCVVSFDQPRRLTGAERALLIALSGLIAQALERARLFDAEHAQAQALQRTLLTTLGGPMASCSCALIARAKTPNTGRPLMAAALLPAGRTHSRRAAALVRLSTPPVPRARPPTLGGPRRDGTMITTNYSCRN